MEWCKTCGVPRDHETTEKLWDIYERIEDGRCRREPLVYSREEYEESWDDDGETNWAMVAMERDMHSRGLCTDCGRPDLSGVTEDMVMSEEDAREMHEMWAEMEAERRMGA